jgi:hypothetical protein
MAHIDETKGDAEPTTSANHDAGRNRRNRHTSCHLEARNGSKRDQRAYSNSCGGPEDGHSRLSPKGQAKLSRQEIRDADRDGELDRSNPRMIEVVERERCPVALPVRHP